MDLWGEDMSLVLLGRGTPRRQEFHKVVTSVGGLLGHQVQFPQKENSILLAGYLMASVQE